MRKVKFILERIKSSNVLLCCAQDYILDFEVYQSTGDPNNRVFKIAWDISLNAGCSVLERQEVWFTEKDLSAARLMTSRPIFHILTEEKHHYFFEMFEDIPISALKPCYVIVRKPVESMG